MNHTVQWSGTILEVFAEIYLSPAQLLSLFHKLPGSSREEVMTQLKVKVLLVAGVYLEIKVLLLVKTLLEVKVLLKVEPLQLVKVLLEVEFLLKVEFLLQVTLEVELKAPLKLVVNDKNKVEVL